jgi:hypothetical protein
MFEFEHTKTQQELKTTLKTFKYFKHFHSSDLFRVWYFGAPVGPRSTKTENLLQKPVSFLFLSNRLDRPHHMTLHNMKTQ